MDGIEPVQKSSVIFMDETGALKTDRIFAVGILKCPTPAVVQRPLTLMRDRRHFYDELKRRAIVGVCRMRSTGVDLFQVLDLLLGAVAYDYKVHAGLIPLAGKSPKRDLLAHILGAFAITTFVGGVRGPRLNTAEYGNAKAPSA